MDLVSVMSFLEQHGSEQSRKVLRRHGAMDPFFGVKVGDMKILSSKIKKDHKLALELYRTGNSDSMYFAGLIADPALMTEDDLRYWAENAYWYMLSDYTVAGVASRSNHGFRMALGWIDSENEFIQSAGWSTLSSYISYFDPDIEETDILRILIRRVSQSLQDAKNRVRYSMNGFIIACGTYLDGFYDESIGAARGIGKVNVDMGGTACKVPAAETTLHAIKEKGRLGKKRKLP